MQNITAQLNQSNCITSVNDFLYTHYINICTGSTTNVQYGGLDIAVAVFCGLMVIGLIIGIIELARS